ncbi:hypothetical protein DHEL01_v212246 [Diaporthe helianthi]|uniref:Uncharacterized protein n=1 Tax=Diaporthe helianthi TaxID=158607 RepID=A0A2P5HGJ3_DIAHE|nr:hypothetical protein DHEL01_v212246 [Diaporthe helianthi]
MPRPRRGHWRWHSNENEAVYNDLNRSKDKAKEQSLIAGSLKTTAKTWGPFGQPQHCPVTASPNNLFPPKELHSEPKGLASLLQVSGHGGWFRILQSHCLKDWWCGKDAPGQQDMAESQDEEELDPALLGSLDYHSFLHTSEAKGACSAETSPLPGTIIPTHGHKHKRIRATFHDCKPLGASLNDRRANESPVLSLSHEFTQSLSHHPFPELRETVSTIRTSSGEALAGSGRSEALKGLPKLELSVLAHIPASLIVSTISTSSSLTTTPLLCEGTLRSIPSGPLSTISSREVDAERLQPFISPLRPQPHPQLPFSSPIKILDPCTRSIVSMVGQVDDSKLEQREGDTRRSLEQTAGKFINQKKGKGLRKKISRFFSSDQPGPTADATAATTYQPLSLATSQDAERLSLSEIFDDVYNVTRGSQGSLNAGCNSYQNAGHVSNPAPPGDLLFPTKPELSGTQDCEATFTAVPVPNSSCQVKPPPLMDHLHPAIKDNLEIQQGLGVTGNKSDPQSTPRAADRHHPAEKDSGTSSCFVGPASTLQMITSTARLVEGESKATTTLGTQEIDPLPAFDRTVDLTWYRTAREQRGTIICSIPRPSSRFEPTLALFVAQFTKGRPFRKHDGTKRFPYFNLPSNVRFEIVRYLLADTDPARPILLNSQRQARPAWPADAFVSLKSVLEPLWTTMWACPRLRAEVMVVLLLTRKFHVIFSPCVRECTQPLPTTWLFRYLRLMQDVSLEIDMTKLGFGYSWDSAYMEPSITNIRGLIRKFTAEMLSRSPDNSMGSLTIHCRRYFGYRQGPNTFQGRNRARAHRYLPVGGEHDEPRATVPDQPHNYNRRSPSLPPSAAKSYSGHLRHHFDRPHRVPYLTEDQLEVANPLRALTGRVESVRMVGFSEKWTYASHLALWPEAERDAVSDTVKQCHIHRQTPSPCSYTAPGHAVFLDYGFAHGVHRYPPLPDSEPMVCVDYDNLKGLFVELGSGNVVSVTKRGAEFHFSCTDPPTPSLISGITPGNSAWPADCQSLTFVPRASRIPTPTSRDMISPVRAMRKRTPVKAAGVLGLTGTMMTSSEGCEDDGLCDTSTKPPAICNNRAGNSGNATNSPASATRLGKMADQKSRSGSDSGGTNSGELPAKRSFHFLSSRIS